MKENIKKAKLQIEEALNYIDAKNIVSDNKITFNYSGEKYRVCLPTLEQERLLEEKKAEKLNQILSKVDENGNPIYLFKNQWKEIYKKRGIDLEAEEGKISIYNIDIENLLLKLAETKDVPQIRKLEEKIEDLKNKLAETVAFLVDKYQYCVEYTILFFSKNYLLSLVLEKKEKNGWKKVFKSFEEMEKNGDPKLIRLGLNSLSYLTDFGENEI